MIKKPQHIELPSTNFKNKIAIVSLLEFSCALELKRFSALLMNEETVRINSSQHKCHIHHHHPVCSCNYKIGYYFLGIFIQQIIESHCTAFQSSTFLVKMRACVSVCVNVDVCIVHFLQIVYTSKYDLNTWVLSIFH